MRVKNYTLSTLNETFSGRIHEAFKSSTLTQQVDLDIDRLIIYNEIVTQIIDLGYNNYYNEIESRVTKGEDPNEVIKSILIRNDETKSTIGYHLNIIQHFIDVDFMKRFI